MAARIDTTEEAALRAILVRALAEAKARRESNEDEDDDPEPQDWCFEANARRAFDAAE